MEWDRLVIEFEFFTLEYEPVTVTGYIIARRQVIVKYLNLKIS